jgi:uncharacterized NAD(P)/FAD-binding protein YdhS
MAMLQLRHIAIVGAGFSGTALAIRLLQLSTEPVRISLLDQHHSFGPGIAYNPYSSAHLLNVAAGKMSLFADQPQHFVDWLLQQPDYRHHNPALLAQAYLSRALYGQYIQQLLAEQISQHPRSQLDCLQRHIVQIQPQQSGYLLTDSREQQLWATEVVLACGNQSPRNFSFLSSATLQSNFYQQNPWQIPQLNTASDAPILILGNGLSMVDTVLALKAQGNTKTIVSLSPHGFQILPHRHPGLSYPDMVKELEGKSWSLSELVPLFNKHRKIIRSLGISAEPLVDSLRPLTQQIWQGWSLKEKQRFVRLLRHLWGVARHRLPLHIHDQLQQWQIKGELQVLAGRVQGIEPSAQGYQVLYQHQQTEYKLTVSQIINCTGPETDLSQLKQGLFAQLLQQGLIKQDELKLGIQVNPETYQVRDAQGEAQVGFYAIGPLLRAELWESTAVNELRQQALQLAQQLSYLRT